MNTTWLQGNRLRILRLASFTVVVLITLYLFSIRDQASELAAYGYPGIFLLSFLTNATLILPMPGIAVTFAAGAIFDPLMVGLAAGTGAALGEITGYMAGFSSQGTFEKSSVYMQLENWTRRFGGLAIFVIALVPNPLFDLAGAAAGALKMHLARFLLWAWFGKTLKMVIIAFAGAFSANWVLNLFTFSP